MSNTFGTFFRVTTFGESHGPVMGVVVDGIESNFPLDLDKIQNEVHRRSSGQNIFETSRKEKDIIKVVSGIFEGKTLGTPITVLVENTEQNASDYEKLKDVYRPGHADLTYQERYGIRDYRGGGRASGRETVSRVIAGAIARQVLSTYNVKIQSKILSIGNTCIKTGMKAGNFEEVLQKAKEEGDSVGGIIECTISGFPKGVGEPVFDKLDACIAHAVMSIGAVKGIEFGSGFESTKMLGSQNNKPENAGGILGGISDGNDICFKVAVKPTPSISKEQKATMKDGSECDISIEGRHDTCICLRIGPVIEAMSAIVLLDQLYARKATSRRDEIERN